MRIEERNRASAGLAPPLVDGAEDERQALPADIQRLAAILDTSEDAIIGSTLDGIVVSWNRGAERLYGYPAEEIVGKPLTIIVPSDRVEEISGALERIRRGERIGSFETVRVARDGRRIHVSIAISPTPDASGAITGAVGIVRDVTERRRAEELIRQAEERYRSLVETIPAVTYVDAVDADSSALYMSPQVEPLVGYSPDEWSRIPDLWMKLVHPDDREWVLAEHARTNNTGDPFSVEYRLIRRDGRVIWVRDEAVLVRGKGGKPRFWQGVIMDVTERKQAEEQIEFLAYHDKLTRLPNRARFEEVLGGALARARRNATSVAVLYMDLDNFKLVNDSLGHSAGDELLLQMATRLRGLARESDLVARQGGDEFMILIDDLETDPPLGAPDAVRATEVVAGRIEESLRVPFILAGHEFFISASIGISLYPKDGSDGETLMRNADSAMYESKRWRRGGHVVFASRASDPLTELSFSTQLRRAVERQDWVMHYQPQVDLVTGDVRGVEGLIRWQDPDGQLILPGMFILAAEEMGLSEAIGDWVLEEVCRQARTWKDEGFDLSVSFNVSPRQLRSRSLAGRVLRTIEAVGVDPSSMVVEVTETTAMTDADRTESVLGRLHAGGVRLAIDDFGTGYSSLSRLKYLPFDVLKIDRSFVKDLPDDPNAAGIAAAIVQLAESLGVEVVAEGIETEPQRRFLLDRGCRWGQGFLFSRPVPAGEVSAMLCRRRAMSG